VEELEELGQRLLVVVLIHLVESLELVYGDTEDDFGLLCIALVELLEGLSAGLVGDR
jgi:hypothetical protein